MTGQKYGGLQQPHALAALLCDGHNCARGLRAFGASLVEKLAPNLDAAVVVILHVHPLKRLVIVVHDAGKPEASPGPTTSKLELEHTNYVVPDIPAVMSDSCEEPLMKD